MSYSNATLVGNGAVLYGTLGRFLNDRTAHAGILYDILTEERDRYNAVVANYKEVVLPEDLLQFVEDAAQRELNPDPDTVEGYTVMEWFDYLGWPDRFDCIRVLRSAIDEVSHRW